MPTISLLCSSVWIDDKFSQTHHLRVVTDNIPQYSIHNNNNNNNNTDDDDDDDDDDHDHALLQ